MSVKFENNTIKIQDDLKEKSIAFLYEAGGELLSQVQRNTRTDTGQLKNSWKLVVDEREMKAVVGSPLENAIWEEYGTGEYALNGDGRKSPWVYKDVKGDWHKTSGKKPSRALFKAINSIKPKILNRLQNLLKGG